MANKIGFGLALQNYVSPGESIGMKDLVKLAAKAENLGYGSIWVWDHIFLGSKNVFPVHESLTVLSAVASVTERVKMATGVLVLPLRNPVELAKRAATLDHLSSGRIILGVAAGWYEREFQACGVPFASRGEILEKNIEIMKRLWTENQVNGAYEKYQLRNVTMEPKPYQKPHIPIWMGGYTERAHERLGRLADGWVCYFYTHESFSRGWQRIVTNTKKAGRDPSTLGNCNMLPVRIDKSREDGLHTLKNFVTKYCDLPAWSEATMDSGIVGNQRDCLDSIEKHRAVGVQNIVIVPAVSSLGEIDLQVERFANDVIRSF